MHCSKCRRVDFLFVFFYLNCFSQQHIHNKRLESAIWIYPKWRPQRKPEEKSGGSGKSHNGRLIISWTYCSKSAAKMRRNSRVLSHLRCSQIFVPQTDFGPRSSCQTTFLRDHPADSGADILNAMHLGPVACVDVACKSFFDDLTSSLEHFSSRLWDSEALYKTETRWQLSCSSMTLRAQVGQILTELEPQIASKSRVVMEIKVRIVRSSN